MLTTLLLQAAHYENSFLNENKSQPFLQSVRNRLCTDLVKAKEKINALKQNINISTAQIAGVATLVTAGIGTYYMCNNDSQESPSINSLTPYVDSLVNTGIATIGAALSKNSWPVVLGSLSLLVKPVVAQNCLKEPIPDQIVDTTELYTKLINARDIFKKPVDFLTLGAKGYDFLPNWLRLEGCFNGTRNSLDVPAIQVTLDHDKLLLTSAKTFYIFDINNPQKPFLISEHPMEWCKHIKKLNDTVILSGPWRATILNVSNPKIISKISEINFNIDSGWSSSDVEEQRLYITNTNALLSYDISDISKPQFLKSYPLPSTTNNVGGYVIVQNKIAYIAKFDSGFQIIDMRDPSNPVYGKYLFRLARDVKIRNTTAFLACAAEGFSIIDVSNPANPALLSKLFFLNSDDAFLISIQLSNSRAFLTDIRGNFFIVDISDLNKPMPLVKYYIGGVPVFSAIKDNLAFIADEKSVEIIDMSQGLLKGTATHASNYKIEVTDANCTNSFLIISDKFPKRTNVPLVDLSLLNQKSFKKNLHEFFEKDGDFLSINIKQNNNQSLPQWLELTPLPSLIYRNYISYNEPNIFIQKDKAFIWTKDKLQIWDIKLVLPSVVGNYKAGFTDLSGTAHVPYIPNQQWIFGVNNNQIIFPSINSFLFDPKKISKLYTYNLPEYITKITVTKDSHIFASYGSIIQILKIPDSLPLKNLTEYITNNEIINFCIYDQKIFLITLKDKTCVEIVDVQKITQPTLLSNTCWDWKDQSATGIAIKDNIIYIAADWNGIYMGSFDKDGKIVWLPTIAVPGGAKIIKIKSNLLFAGSNTAGIHILDINNPKNPIFWKNNPTLGFVSDFDFYGKYIYALIDSQLQIIDFYRWTLSGNPSAVDIGNYQINITASDELGVSIWDTLNIRVEGAPILKKKIDKQYAKIGRAFNYFVPEDVFVDPNNDPLIFSTKKENMQTLPKWMTFNPISATFTGMPPEMDNQSLPLFIKASDNIAGSINTTFDLYIDHAPQLYRPILDQIARINKFYEQIIPKNTFIDLDNDFLTYSNSTILPKWINFISNKTVTKLFGTPRTKGPNSIRIIAKDPYDGIATAEFIIDVQENHRPEVIGVVLDVPNAVVNNPYALSIDMKTIFKDSDGDKLTYFISPAVDWLTYSITEEHGIWKLSGKPSRSDHNFFGNILSKKIYTINLIAQDDQNEHARTSFDINMTGDSYGALLLKILGPIGFVYELYSNRAFVINKWHKFFDHYKRPMIEIFLDNKIDFEKTLGTPAKNIDTVQAFSPNTPTPSWYQFWKNDMETLSGGNLLPYWLSYHERENKLYTNGAGPNLKDIGNIIIQVKDRGGIIKEEYLICVKSDKVPTQSQNIFEDVEMMYAEPLLTH